jgi:plastocyanin
MFEFDGLSMIFSGGWVQVDPALASFDIEFYDDPYAEHTIPFDEFVTSFSAGPALSSTPGDVYAGFYQAYRWEIPCPDVQLADLEGGIYMTETAAGGGCLWGNSGDGDGWSYQEAVGPTTDGDRAMTLFDGAHILFDQTVIDPLGAWSFINIDQSLGYGGYESFFLTPAIAGHAMDLNCTVVIDEGFEDEFNWPPIGWTTYGFFPDQGPEYGEPSHTGIHHLYTNSAGDSAVTPTIWFRDENTLSFWYAVESSSYPQDLEVYVDGAGSPIWSLYNFDNEDYIQVVLTNELDPYANGNHTIEFYNPRTAFTFGSMVDDVIVETCIQEGPDIVPNEIWVNFTYQVDMDVGEVIVEYVMYNATEDCCPPGETAWTTLGDPIFGRYPGACQFFSQPLTVTHNNLCLRLRLDTRDLPYEIWGIGFHMHEIFISDIVHDAFDNMTYNFYEDFEDGTLTIQDQPGEAPNLAWCIDCVKYGEHWSDIDDFTFICGGTEIPGYMPLECQDFKFVGIDTYGDGWWYPYTYIDIYVNGVQVVDDFTLPPYNTPYAEVEFEACGGDIIGIDVEIQSPSYWPYEMEFYLYDASGNKWWSDGENGGTPSPGLTEIELPLEAFVIPPGAYWPAEPIDTACVWETEIEDCYEAYLYGEWMYSLPSGCQVTVEVSVDGGDNWFIIAQLDGPAEQLSWVQIPCTIFDLTAFVGNKILVRTHVDNYGANPGFLMIRNYEIYGKQDMIPPTIAISLSGNNIGGNMYAGPVTVTLTATDNKGVKEIHYIVDGGAETIVAGDTATFTVSGDGDHTVTAWAVDIVNNVGASASASFSIDATPPTVEITAPEPGLYLFGNQLLSMSKPFIIGAFTIEATADDAQGVAYVEFFINGESLGADLEAPYSAYCAVKNMGAAEISAVAVDGVGNSAEDSLDVTYYKFL